MPNESILRSLGHIRHVLPLEVKIGDFLFLHTRHFQTFGIVIREPSRLMTDPFNDVFEIVDIKGNLVWGRGPSVKFFYPSLFGLKMNSINISDKFQPPSQNEIIQDPNSVSNNSRKQLNKETFIKLAHSKLKKAIFDSTQYQISSFEESIVEDWAHSLGDQSAFNLWDAYQVVKECSNDLDNEFDYLFLLFQFLYTKSTRIVRDTAYRVNGPFAYRKQSQHLLLERCESYFSKDNFPLLSKFKTKLTKLNFTPFSVENELERDLIEGMKNFAYCTFENSRNNPFSMINKKLFIAKYIKSPPEMNDFLSVNGLVSPLLNPRIIESNLELEHSPSVCTQSLSSVEGSEKDSVLHEYRYNQSIRKEYSSAPVFTIDSLKASEIDDGISVDLDGVAQQNILASDNFIDFPDVENVWFHVHIADCVAYYNTSEPVDLIGRRMINSVYLPEQTFPMLPWKITQVMSLEPTKSDNFCLSFSFRLNSRTGDLQETKITPTLVSGKNICKITYDSVDIKQNPHLKMIYKGCLLHRKFRDQKSRIDVELPQPQIWVGQNEDGFLNSNYLLKHAKRNQSSNSHKNKSKINQLHFEYQSTQAQTDNEQLGHFIVSEMMIIAGRVASEFCRE